MSGIFWEMISTAGLVLLGFFVSFAPHKPVSRLARFTFYALPLVLFVVSQILWLSTGRGLLEQATCAVFPSSVPCRVPAPETPEQASTAQSDRSKQPKPAPATTTPTTGAATEPGTEEQGTDRTRPAVTTPPAPRVPRPYVVRLTENNAKDIWTTSVYSYAPDRKTPGGGLENDRLRAGGWGDLYYILFQFSLPHTDCKSKVVLQLYNNHDGGMPTAMYLNIITHDWGWQRGDRLWWKDLPTFEPWQNEVIQAPVIDAWLSIDLTDIFGKWCRGEMPNYGILLSPVLNNNNFDSFNSTRYVGGGDLEPRLIVTPPA